MRAWTARGGLMMAIVALVLWGCAETEVTGLPSPSAEGSAGGSPVGAPTTVEPTITTPVTTDESASPEPTRPATPEPTLAAPPPAPPRTTVPPPTTPAATSPPSPPGPGGTSQSPTAPPPAPAQPTIVMARGIDPESGAATIAVTYRWNPDAFPGESGALVSLFQNDVMVGRVRFGPGWPGEAPAMFWTDDGAPAAIRATGVLTDASGAPLPGSLVQTSTETWPVTVRPGQVGP